MQGFAVLEQVVHGAHFVEPSPAPSLAKMQALKTTCVVLESTTTSKVHRRRRISSGLQTVQAPDTKHSPFGRSLLACRRLGRSTQTLRNREDKRRRRILHPSLFGKHCLSIVGYVAAYRTAARSPATCRSCGERQNEYMPEFVQFRPEVLVQQREAVTGVLAYAS